MTPPPELLVAGPEGPVMFVPWEYARFHNVGKHQTHGLCLQRRTAPTWPTREMTTLEDMLTYQMTGNDLNRGVEPEGRGRGLISH